MKFGKEMGLRLSSSRMALAVLGALVATTATAADAVIAPGQYVMTLSSGCGKLDVGVSTIRYAWDERCDGSTDYRGGNVYLRGSKLYIDAATLSIEAQSETCVSVPWRLGQSKFRATFVKQ